MENNILTGFCDLDELTKGIGDSELIFIGARPGIGKTSFSLNIAKYVVEKQKIPTVFFSLEMSEEQVRKCIANMEWHLKSDLIIDDTPAITVEEIASKCKKLKEERKLGLIIIDYLQLLEDEETNRNCDSKRKKMSSVMYKLKKLACELSTPVIVTSHMPRPIERRENKRPILQDLRLVGDVEQNADIIIFLYRDECYNKDTEQKGIAEVIVAKRRVGKSGTIELAFLSEKCTFCNLLRGWRKNYENT